MHPAIIQDRPAAQQHTAVMQRIWRLHFWVGLFTAPFLVTLAITGLIILYSQPLHNWLNHDLFVVAPGHQTISLDDQVSVAITHITANKTGPEQENPTDNNYVLDAVIPAPAPDRSTRVDFIGPDSGTLPAGESNLTQVFINPYTGQYLGQRNELSGLVGFANQVHRMFGNDGPQVHLPSLGHLINPTRYPEPTIAVGIGNIWLELTAVWVLVLCASGLYLWWPRALRGATTLFAAALPAALTIRWRHGGRIRWRDLHAATGALLAVLLMCYIVSGLTWSRYWGENWRAVTATITPSAVIDAASTPATMGDYDRLGRRIAWSATDDPIYASTPEQSHAHHSITPATSPSLAPSLPTPSMNFADIDRIARDENMVPGYSILLPHNTYINGQPVYGSYAVVNPWPQKLSEQRTLYIDQFSGNTIANATSAQDGALERLTNFGIAMHMGNQLGWITRIISTTVCLGIFISIATGFTMWYLRRPTGGTGLPRLNNTATRAATSPKTVKIVCAIAIALGVLYPSFGISLLVVLAGETLVRRLTTWRKSL